jgi:hypothetical protein
VWESKTPEKGLNGEMKTEKWGRLLHGSRGFARIEYLGDENVMRFCGLDFLVNPWPFHVSPDARRSSPPFSYFIAVLASLRLRLRLCVKFGPAFNAKTPSRQVARKTSPCHIRQNARRVATHNANVFRIAASQ